VKVNVWTERKKHVLVVTRNTPLLMISHQPSDCSPLLLDSIFLLEFLHSRLLPLERELEHLQRRVGGLLKLPYLVHIASMQDVEDTVEKSSKIE
jgi:hypothetical protein